ncbi:MAG: GTP-binding protein [Pirellulaceae bacterium]
MTTPKIRFIMIGGFLGAGKTTTIGRLAKAYQDQGLKVGVVTNDQAADLVDTNLLRSQGLDVGEVAGACFCCNFNELTSTVEKLAADQRPDIVLAEPVGSCTDLVATVIQPLLRMFDAQFEVAPYGVILKPSHGLRILGGGQGSGFSPKAAYIFEKQLEEADFILVNRIDELTDEQVATLTAHLEKLAPGTPILRYSAKTGQGQAALEAMLAQEGDFGTRILELDYDIYAEGEAELGWLNSSLRVTGEPYELEDSVITEYDEDDEEWVVAPKPFDLDQVLMGIIERLQAKLAARDAETAHLKTIGLWEGFYGVANLISSDTPPVLSLASNCQATEADVVVNARVALDPKTLQTEVEAAVHETAAALGVTVEFRQTQSFRPGRPVPTHRFTATE